MKHLRNLGNSISVQIRPDESGFTGRECPNSECEGYFKIEFGTGLQEDNLPCHCPYCGHTASHDHFWSQAQIEYARSIARRQIADAWRKDLKKLEFNHKPKGDFGIGISMKLKPGRSAPIHHYRENRLETEVICSDCALRYSVYGVFAFCPDCGRHNSLQILDKNLEVVTNMLKLSKETQSDIAERLTENALEDCVSAFDGFGREICRVHASKAVNPWKAEKLRLQNLDGAKDNVLCEFGFDLSSTVSANLWRSALQAFQKRHLLAHKMGVIDQGYIDSTGDPVATVGRKIQIANHDVQSMIEVVRTIAKGLHAHLEGMDKEETNRS